MHLAVEKNWAITVKTVDKELGEQRWSRTQVNTCRYYKHSYLREKINTINYSLLQSQGNSTQLNTGTVYNYIQNIYAGTCA